MARVLIWTLASAFMPLYINLLSFMDFKAATDLAVSSAYIPNALLTGAMLSPIIIFRRGALYNAFAYFWAALFSVANNLIINFRGTPITASDIALFREAQGVAGQYLTKDNLFIPVLIITFHLSILITALLFSLKKENPEERSIFVKTLSVLLASAVIFSYTFVFEDVSKTHTSVMNWDLKSSYRQNGVLYSFYYTYHSMKREKPEGYNLDSVKQALSSPSEAGIMEKPDIKPNVIVVQLEAFYDVTSLSDISFSQDPVPNYHRIQTENSSGVLKVPTIGGGTVRTEFETLTGANLSYFSPGEIPYSTVGKQTTYPSLAKTLTAQGYQAHAIHDYLGNYYDRNKVFSAMGFDTFTSIEFMNGYDRTALEWPKDKVLVEYIRKCLESTTGSDFVFTVAVQTHGGYPSYNVKLDHHIDINSNLDDSMKKQLDYYVQNIKEVDDFIGNLDTYIESLDEPTIVLLYSDHLPAIDIIAKADPNLIPRYETQYVLFSNYEISNENRTLSSYQLSAMLLEKIGVEGSTLDKLNMSELIGNKDESAARILNYDIFMSKEKYSQLYPSENKMVMGIDKIEITSTSLANGKIVVKGENLTPYSKIFINSQQKETTFISENQIECDAKSASSGDKVEIKQLGRYDIPLSITDAQILE